MTTNPMQEIFNRQINLLARMVGLLKTSNEILEKVSKSTEIVLKEYESHLLYLQSLKDKVNDEPQSQDDI